MYSWMNREGDLSRRILSITKGRKRLLNQVGLFFFFVHYNITMQTRLQVFERPWQQK